MMEYLAVAWQRMTRIQAGFSFTRRVFYYLIAADWRLAAVAQRCDAILSCVLADGIAKETKRQ